MSEGVHAVQHEVEHRIGHDEHEAGHGTNLPQSRNRKIALLIAVLALFLALSETLGKSAQTSGLELNIKASDTWNFFQAKTVRQTTLRTAAEAFAIELAGRSDDANKAAMSTGARSSKRKPSNTSASAIPPWRATTIMSSDRRRIRSGLCLRRPQSSPA
jgi:Domain of unknown function (DUF4337)